MDNKIEFEIQKSNFTEKEIIIKIIKKYNINIKDVIDEMNKDKKEKENACEIHNYVKYKDNKKNSYYLKCYKCQKINNCQICLAQIFESKLMDMRISVEKECEKCKTKNYLRICEICESPTCFCGCSKGCMCDGNDYY